MAWLLASAFVALQSAVLSLVNDTVKDDYMDEVFHGPQAREYCRGDFASWHPKITTFPGVYYLGTAYGWGRWAAQALVGKVVNTEEACSTPFLRSLNVLLSLACLLTTRAILRHRRSHGRLAPGQARGGPQQQQAASDAAVSPGLHALVLALYPLHWFFSFLYYTDVASLLFLLLCNLQALRRSYLTAALAGAAAVLCRQTNAVWAAFVLGESALAELGLADAPWAAAGSGAGSSGPWRSPRKSGSSVAAGKGGAGQGGGEDEEAARADAAGLLPELGLALSRAWQRRGRLAAALWPLLLPPVGFVAFLVANGGAVVLGDKEAHVPVRHGAQLLYFGGWAALMLWPQLLPEVGALGRAAARRPMAAVVVAAGAVAAAAGVAHVSTLVHPYVLADNRHYVFYLWRRLLDRHRLARYALAPANAAAWALLLSGLRRSASRLWLLGFLACVAATLLPAWLLELRYFTPGLFLAAMRLRPPSPLQAGALLATYAVVDAGSMFLFLRRPFIFADGSVARFMW
ncbi:hypothetical protein HYH03_018515 [Edaphochlamys debaryana]|uniref:Dol-P-Glc:Glc(2)Man(9)GlcNAc(2)-PP-Dol alpha-1,2-glucosyltransferase n=1 Tax=Edaphochlamys debaryana TaxID=47281 RepID=A0A835XHR9_9CHLO|nr:hypothetical protein HYH03_018515 [Edaphochlamys debaryana]|eukprot:KAG2482556.1 hypothetical protein HYH03_018515 [Edaphochlamys debaryana]